jgi:thioredoxin reductase
VCFFTILYRIFTIKENLPMSTLPLPVAVIGAGPVGLAAAAHLLERGETPIVFEAGTSIGASVREWAHVRMFSPWRYNVDSASVRLLEAHGWQMPPADELPTGGDLVERYMQPLASLPEMHRHLHLNARVAAVSRRNIDRMKDDGRQESPFVLHVIYASGEEAMIEARAVIDASGTWRTPNPLGANGLPAIGEKRHAAHIAYGIPNVLGDKRMRYENRRVLVVGSGHSAINALLELAELHRSAAQTSILWAMRGSNLRRVYGGGEDDALPARGQLGTRVQALVDAGVITILSPFRILEVRPGEGGMDVIGDDGKATQCITVDEIITATGARPDTDLLRELRLDLDPSLESTRALAPLIDPNVHSCGTVRPHGEAELRQPEKDFYIVGMKSYGRAPTFLLATGYEQVRSVVAGLVGDWDAARDVQLNLPETGVCSTDLAGEGGACCAPAVSAAPSFLSLESIQVGGFTYLPATLGIAASDVAALQPAPVALETVTRACGCNDTCCGDGVRSQTCGCDTACCS